MDYRLFESGLIVGLWIIAAERREKNGITDYRLRIAYIRVLGLRINVISRSGLIIGLWIIAAKRLGLMAD